MARLNYNPDGQGNVGLTLISDDGQSIGVVVTESYLRAKAWSILNDLDPTEAVACGAQSVSVGEVSDEEVASAEVVFEKGGIVQRDQVLLSIAKGHGTSTITAQNLRLPRTRVCSRLSELCDRGLVVAIRVGRGRGNQSVYGLTRDGVIRARRLGLTPAEFAAPPAHLLGA